MAFMRPALLRNGCEITILDVDVESGWPIAEVPGLGLVPVDPVTIQEGWNYDRDD
jgi:hypothetical protein